MKKCTVQIVIDVSGELKRGSQMKIFERFKRDCCLSTF